MSVETLTASPWMKAFLALLVLLGLVDFFLDHDGHMAWYYILLAGGGAVSLLVIARLVQALLQRSTEYYDD